MHTIFPAKHFNIRMYSENLDFSIRQHVALYPKSVVLSCSDMWSGRITNSDECPCNHSGSYWHLSGSAFFLSNQAQFISMKAEHERVYFVKKVTHTLLVSHRRL